MTTGIRIQETYNNRNKDSRNIGLQELGYKKHRTTGTRIQET